MVCQPLRILEINAVANHAVYAVRAVEQLVIVSEYNEVVTTSDAMGRKGMYNASSLSL